MSAARTSILFLIPALLIVSCGDDATAPTTSQPSATSSVPPGTEPRDTPTTAAVTTTTALPGEPYEAYPPQGALLGVVGVAHDDVLNVRMLPGLTEVIATLDPTRTDVVSAGEGRRLERTIWWKVDVDGETGWVNAAYLAYLGAVDDLTSVVVDAYGDYPAAATMAELGRIVAETMASDDPPSNIVMTAAPSGGDLGEVTYDVVGLGDDSVAGYRLHVFAMPDADGFTLKSVEATALCSRGVAEGVCV